MRTDRLTSKFQQARGDAQSLTLGRDNQFIEPLRAPGQTLPPGTARRCSPQPKISACKVDRMTWEGHDFLDAARKDSIWDQAKE